MKEKRHVCFGGALTKGKKLKYITYLVLKSYASQASVIFVKHNYFFCLWRKHQSALAAGKTKKINNIRVEKVPTWLWCQCDFPKVIKHPSLSICYFLFWSYLFYAFYSFSLAVVAIFRFCHRRTYCCCEAICFMHFIPFHLRLSPFFASAIVVHIVADRIVFFFFTAKWKVYLYLFFYFSVFSIFFTEGKIQLCFTRLDRQYTFSSHRTG